jgi:thioredoxin
MKKAILILLFSILTFICFAQEVQQDSTVVKKPKITFLELGSVSCIPCQQMEKVLESVREKYGDQIEVIFHDVKKEKEMAAKYEIRMIPTQVFLDADGKEIHRHVGFYPEELIDTFLKEQGLEIIHSSKE